MKGLIAFWLYVLIGVVVASLTLAAIAKSDTYGDTDIDWLEEIGDNAFAVAGAGIAWPFVLAVMCAAVVVMQCGKLIYKLIQRYKGES